MSPSERAVNEGRLFVWRGQDGFFYILPRPFAQVPGVQGVHALTTLICPYCSGSFQYDFSEYVGWFMNVPGWERMPIEADRTCTRCGFFITERAEPDRKTGYVNVCGSMSLLRDFHLTDPELTTDEILAHLSRRRSDVHHLSPRRFECLVGDVYRNLGYKVRLTQQTKDGGFDLILLEGPSEEAVLVECKLLGPSKKLSVAEVRKLAGVQLIEDFTHGILVVSTEPSLYAVRTASRLNAGSSGYSVELKALTDLLNEMEVLNAKLPPPWLGDKPEKRAKRTAEDGERCSVCGLLPGKVRHQVPPQSMFVGGERKAMLSVLACVECSERLARDEDYFVTRLLMRHDVYEHAEARRLLDALAVAETMRGELQGLNYDVEFDRIRLVLHCVCQGIARVQSLVRQNDDLQMRLFELDKPVNTLFSRRVVEALGSGRRGETDRGIMSYRANELAGGKALFELTFFGRVAFLVAYGCDDSDLYGAASGQP